MLDLDNAVDIIIENVKKLFFPEEWIKLDLKFSKFEIFTMLYLDKKKETTMTELVEYINTPMSTATGIIDRLVKNGYVVRDRSETDRRIVIIKLTKEGIDLIKDLKNTISGYINIIIEDLTDEEKRFMTNIIFKILDKLQNKLSSQESNNNEINQVKKIDIE